MAPKKSKYVVVQNIVHGVVTSVAGFAALLGSVYFSTFTDKMDWLWEGVVGVMVGVVLIISPSSIKGFADMFVRSKTNSNDQSPA